MAIVIKNKFVTIKEVVEISNFKIDFISKIKSCAQLYFPQTNKEYNATKEFLL